MTQSKQQKNCQEPHLAAGVALARWWVAAAAVLASAAATVY